MILLRKSGERQRVRRSRYTGWLSFRHDDPTDDLASGFGALRQLSEQQVGPGAGLPLRESSQSELVTQVIAGTVVHGRTRVRTDQLQAGEIQRVVGARELRLRHHNPSATDSAHVIQLWFSSEAPLPAPDLEQRRFPAASRRGRLLLVASPDGRDGSLRIHHNALVYSALLERGQHLVHGLSPGRGAWLQVLSGRATLDQLWLSPGDAVAISWERSVSLTADASAELLLVELDEGSVPNA
jgi:redox-sensitive bicupin YhaK (pirin superfamily)